MVKINRPVDKPIAEQDITLSLGSAIQSGDLAWLLPLVVGGVTPAPGEDKTAKPAPIHAAGVKIMAAIQDGGSAGSILTLTVFSVESAGAAIAADTETTQRLGQFSVPLDLVLSNANVPRP